MDYLSIFQLNTDNGRVAYERNVLSIVIHAVVMENKDGIGVVILYPFLSMHLKGSGEFLCLGLFPKKHTLWVKK